MTSRRDRFHPHIAPRVPRPAPAVTFSGVRAALGEQGLALTVEPGGFAIQRDDVVLQRVRTLAEALGSRPFKGP